jgi:hypothetical protein
MRGGLELEVSPDDGRKLGRPISTNKVDMVVNAYFIPICGKHR